jgi:lysozyme
VVGIWTIGWGHIDGVKEGDTCTEEQAEDWLETEATEKYHQILAVVKPKLTDNQMAALLSFVYNVGIGNFKSSTMLKLINSGDLTAAANEFPRWNKAKGKVVQGLTNRRLDEQKLFLS